MRLIANYQIFVLSIVGFGKLLNYKKEPSIISLQFVIAVFFFRFKATKLLTKRLSDYEIFKYVIFTRFCIFG